MTVQAADGRVHHLEGRDLPDAISLYAGISYRGAHVAEVLLSPKEAQASPWLPVASGWISKRDAFFLVLGFFFFSLVQFLAEATALALM